MSSRRSPPVQHFVSLLIPPSLSLSRRDSRTTHTVTSALTQPYRPMSVSYPYSALALLKYKPPPGSTDSLSFLKGETVTVLEAADEDGDWLRGRNEAGGEGVFPAGFVEALEDTEEEKEVVVDAVKPVEAVDEATPPVTTSTNGAPTESTTTEDVPTPPSPAPIPALIIPTPSIPPPTRKPSLPTPTSAPPPISPASPSSGPPPTAEKPSSLRDRIAALNAVGAGAAGPPPPSVPGPPRPKPTFARQPLPPTAAPTPIPKAPDTDASPSSSLPTPAPAPVESTASSMSPSDALASITKSSGGSLKERIAALQGLKAVEALPAAPGRAPKVWKRKEVEVVPVEEDEVDEVPTVVVDKAVEGDAEKEEGGPTIIDSKSFVASPSPEQEEDPAVDEEASKKAALVQRMAALGEQGMGGMMAMPALPKRAGKPKKKTSATVVVVPEPEVEKEAVESEEKAEEEKAEEEKGEKEVEEKEVDSPKDVPATLEDVKEDSTAAEQTKKVPAVESPKDEVVEEEAELEPTRVVPAVIPSPVEESPVEEETVDEEEFDEEPVDDEVAEEEPIDEEVDQEEPVEEEVVPPSPVKPTPPPPTSFRPPVPRAFVAAPPSLPKAAEPVVDSPKVASLARSLSVDTAAASIVGGGIASPTIRAMPSVPTGFVQKPKQVEEVEPEEEEQVERVEEPAEVEEDQEDAVTPEDEPETVKPVSTVIKEAEEIQEEEEAEEEDPEVVRRAALAKRMAALGGMNMRMGMMPALGGLRKTAKKSTDDTPKEEFSSPPPPVAPRRAGSVPTGGFLLPGIVPRAPAPVEPTVPAEQPVEVEEPEEESPTEEAISPAEEETVEEEEEEEAAPPPLPSGRPSAPPRRSIPVPVPIEDEVAPPPLPAGRPPPSRALPVFVAEPEPVEKDEGEEHDEELEEEEPEEEEQDDEQDEEEDQVPPPIAPRRPTLPPSIPSSSSLRPPVPIASKRDSIASVASLKRVQTGSSEHSSRDVSHQETPYLPPKAGGRRGVDLDLTGGGAWWEVVPFGLPKELRPVNASTEVRESSETRDGETWHDNEIEVIYDDFSTTLISISFAPSSVPHIAQTHTPPPPFPSVPTLIEFSSTIGVQLFAAAHSKLVDKSRTSLTPESLLSACFDRATNPLRPIGGSYGILIYSLKVPTDSTPSKSKSPLSLFEIDPPRAGDVLVLLDTKFKHNLTTTKFGTLERPHVGIVESWDPKKKKIKSIEVGSGGGVEEGGYRMEDLRGGEVRVFRVVPRGFLK